MQAERIYQLRKELKLSQQEFGNKLNITKGLVSKMESDKAPLSNKVKTAIYREFNVNPTWLENGTGEMFLTKTEKDDTAILIAETLKMAEDDNKKRILNALFKIPQEDWETVIKAIELFVEEWTK